MLVCTVYKIKCEEKKKNKRTCIWLWNEEACTFQNKSSFSWLLIAEAILHFIIFFLQSFHQIDDFLL